MAFTKEDYVGRIRNASPIELLLITYELTITNLEDAKHTSDNDTFEKCVRKSQDFLIQLMTSLDMKYPISNNLLNIYIYVNKLLNEAYFSKSKDAIDDCIELLSGLMESFEIISHQTNQDPIMAVSQEVYAGLTYKNGKLDELVVENSKGGFQA